jgi:16S rRNA (adenine1518-N6/adenine1519-N6)-dimethyltransferase
MRRFEEAGIRPDTRRGQNFLIDLNLVRLLADAADLSDRDVVLEVGTGTGSLTCLLAQKAAHVVTIEIDAHLQQLAREELASFDNVTMLRQDALKNKNNFRPNVIETVREKLDQVPDSRFKLAANLPFNIATPVLSNLLETAIVPHSMTATIQRELAERIMAVPGTKDYSALSIWVQSQCDTEIIRVLPPQVFWPRPKVESAIIHILPREEKRAQIPDLGFFHTCVRALFFHRRKYLRSVVLSAFKHELDKAEVDDVLAKLDLQGDERAEQLDVMTVLNLAEALRQTLLQKSAQFTAK